MSMLQAQCDELRATAESVGLAVPKAATLMMDAADTITELRGALQVASADYRHLQAEHERRMAGGTRTARRVIVSDPATDCATGHCECGACGGAIDPWDAWCRHCGARMEDE